MKKVLLATSALVATSGASFAASSLDISGYFEAGIVGGDGGYAAGETQFLQHMQIDFAGTGVTDSGLTFGVTAQVDDISNQNAAGSPGDIRLDSETFFISGDFGKISLGDQDGAYDWALREVAFGTSIADDHTSHGGYNGNSGMDGDHDNQILRYTNSVGDFGFAASIELDDTGANDDIVSVGIKYDMALGGVDVGLGLGYSSGSLGGADATTAITSAGADGLDGTADDGTSLVAAVPDSDADVLGVSVDLAFAGGFGVRLNYSEFDSDTAGADWDHMGIGVAYSTGNVTAEINYGEFDNETGSNDDGWGVAVGYSLGGGASLLFGYADDSNDADRWSLGLGMSF